MNVDTQTLELEILQWIIDHDGAHSLYSKGFFSEVSGNHPCSEREFVAAFQALCRDGLILCRSGLGNLLRPKNAVLAMTVLTVTIAGRNRLLAYS
jgi:hypothetical protein